MLIYGRSVDSRNREPRVAVTVASAPHPISIPSILDDQLSVCRHAPRRCSWRFAEQRMTNEVGYAGLSAMRWSVNRSQRTPNGWQRNSVSTAIIVSSNRSDSHGLSILASAGKFSSMRGKDSRWPRTKQCQASGCLRW
jgi:hypothetical protein